MSAAHDGRTLRIDIWYPARETAITPMRYVDYLRAADDLRAAADRFPVTEGSLRATLAMAITGNANTLAPGVLDRVVHSPMAAARDAPAADGRFRLVLWTPRYGTTAMQPVMSEYLASHGIFVAFARPRDVAMRLPFEIDTPEAKRQELLARVSDMRGAIDALESAGNVIPGRVAVMAWSYTGEIATELQQQDSRVALVIGLSTNLLSDWVYRGASALAALDPSKLKATYAVLTQSREAAARPALFHRLSSAYFIEFPGVAHGSFNALEGYIPSLYGLSPVQRWSLSSPASARAYEAASVIVQRLIRHHLERAAPGSLAPSVLGEGIPEHVARIHRPGQS